MLYSILIKFIIQTDAVISRTRGYYAYAMFLNLLSRANSAIAQEIHDIDGPKPFTISLLEGNFQRQSSGLKVTQGGMYWIRFTFMKGDLFAYFLDAAMRASDEILFLDKAKLQINEIITAPGSSPLCNCQEFGDIIADAKQERQIQLEFQSPTVFRSGGKRNVVFPEPQLVFGSLLTRWQVYSPIKLDDSVSSWMDKILTTHYRLTTRMLDFGTYQELGFTGRCEYEMDKDTPEDITTAINALADFAFYAGVGAKTTMGMGQTHRIK